MNWIGMFQMVHTLGVWATGLLLIATIFLAISKDWRPLAIYVGYLTAVFLILTLIIGAGLPK